jgi:hypothetical protein
MEKCVQEGMCSLSSTHCMCMLFPYSSPPYPPLPGRRKPVACGSVVRLQHLQTHLFLHSHNFRSPLSNNQEVSCFGDGTQGDEGMLSLLFVA